MGDWIFVALLGCGLFAWWLARNRQPPPSGQPGELDERQSRSAAPSFAVNLEVESSAPPLDPAKILEREQRTQRLDAAAALHQPALLCLLAVARADGRIHHGEELEISDFLYRVGQREGRAGVIARVRDQFVGSASQFSESVARVQADPQYRAAVLKSMELIIERGARIHPAELILIEQAAAAWDLPTPRFFKPVGNPSKT